MPLTAGCKPYVEEGFAAAGYSLEETRRRATPYTHIRRALRIESFAGAVPTQVWAYDYDIEAWVLKKMRLSQRGSMAIMVSAATL